VFFEPGKAKKEADAKHLLLFYYAVTKARTIKSALPGAGQSRGIDKAGTYPEKADHHIKLPVSYYCGIIYS
jgi:hypothetical protein